MLEDISGVKRRSGIERFLALLQHTEQRQARVGRQYAGQLAAFVVMDTAWRACGHAARFLQARETHCRMFDVLASHDSVDYRKKGLTQQYETTHYTRDRKPS